MTRESAGPVSPLAECRGCGAWTRARPCPDCGWEALVVTASAGIAPAALRVRIDVVVEHTGRIRLAGIVSHRLPWLAKDPSLHNIIQTHLSGAIRDIESAAEWRDAHEAIEKETGTRISMVFGDEPPPPRPVHANLRVAVHARSIQLGHVAGENIAIVDFSEQMSRLGAMVSPGDLSIDLSEFKLVLDYTQWRGRLHATSTQDLLVTQARLLHGNEAISIFEGEVFCSARVPSTIELPQPTAQELHEIAQALSQPDSPTLKIELSVQGLEPPLLWTLDPRVHVKLPPAERVAALLLDLGTANTRLVLRLGEEADQWIRRAGSTGEMNTMLGLDQRDQQHADSRNWSRLAIPSLAGWAARQHDCFLGDLVLTEHRLKPIHQEARGNGHSTYLLGMVRWEESPRLLAAHTAPTLEALAEALPKFSQLSEQRNREIEQIENWNAKSLVAHQKQIEQFEKSTGMSRMLGELTGDPSKRDAPSKQVPPPFPSPPSNLGSLFAHPERLQHVVLVDIGASSTSLAYLQEFKPIASRGGTRPSVGSDQISKAAGLWTEDTSSREAASRSKLRIQRREDGERAWMRLSESVERVMQPLNQEVLETVQALWGADSFTIVVSGGGVTELGLLGRLSFSIANARLSGWVATPRDLAEAIEMIRNSDPSLALELESRTRGLSDSQAWAEAAGMERSADPFNLVEGMAQVLTSECGFVDE